MTLPHRITIVGAPGSGKTTLAGQLARLLNIVHIELDAIHWGPNWTEASLEELRSGAVEAMQTDGWVVDVNYGAIRDSVWGRADTVVWLNYPLPIVELQLFKRTITRLFRQQVLSNGNIEDWREHFLSRESLFLHTVKSTYKNRRAFPILFNKREYSHLDTIVMKTPGETRNWLESLRHQLPK
jgi:adenylate kinase family enzyme